MTTFFFIVLILATLALFSSCKNGVTLSVICLASSVIMIIKMHSVSGMSWQALITIIMYTSGILVIYLILSTLGPQWFSTKVKYSPVVILTIFWYGLTQSNSLSDLNCYNLAPNLNKKSFLMMMMFLFLIYFLGFIIVFTEKSTCIRTYTL